MAILISGTRKTKEEYFSKFLSCLDNDFPFGEYELSIEVICKKRPVLFLDKTTLLPISGSFNETATLAEAFFIDEELYSILTQETKPVNAKTEPGFTKTTPQKREIETNSRRNENRREAASSVVQSTSPHYSKELYVIESHKEDCESASRPCVLAIKEISNNVLTLFYRRSVFDKGTDTSFRHYLINQPGELVSYRYFNKIESLKDLYSELNLPLRHNGSNYLSKSQCDYILNSLIRLRFL